MGVGIYTIPMSEYYSKSKELKEKVSEVATDLNDNFLTKVSSHISELDSKDQSILEASSSYTSAKTLYEKLENTHGKNLTDMSSFNGQNPLYNIANKDKEFANRFNSIAQGKINDEVTERINSLNQDVDLMGSVLEFLNGVDNLGKNEWTKRIEKSGGLATFLKDLASGHGYRAISFEKLLYDPAVGQAMMSSKKAEKFLEFWMDLPDTIKKTQNWKYVGNWIDKAKTAGKYIGNTKIFTGFFNNRAVDSTLKIGKKILKSDTTKNILKYGGKAVVWGAIAIDIGSSAYKNWNDERTDSKTGVGKFGKVVAGTAIDQIKNVGPLNGMWAGAKVGMAIGGPHGAAIGLVAGGVIGAVNQIGQFIAPDLYDKGINALKDGAYKLVDKAEEAVGKAVKQAANTIKDVGKGVSDFLSGAKNLIPSWF